jgi:hypothetical protein
MIDTNIPNPMRLALEELLVDPRIIEELGLSVAEFALLKTPPQDVDSIRDFIDNMLNSGYPESEFEKWWASMPVSFHFQDGSEVVQFLNEMRKELDKSRLIR